jgi:2-amino-4-hydroxy-6-hydroxymethyldihydropteridine diphosphokinase
MTGTVDSKQQTANSKQQTANSKQQHTDCACDQFLSFRCRPAFHSILHLPHSAVYRLLFAVCCLLFAVYCLLFTFSMLSNAYIGLGSNLGDRAGNLLLGIRGMIEAGLLVNRLSHIYETEPVETFPQPAFLNMVAELRGDSLPPAAEIMARLLQVEHSLGRTRELAKRPRIIDLDLLFFGNEKCDTQLLTLPHPRLHHRRFVLVPLAEIAPWFVHPTLNKTMSELLEILEDDSEVKPWSP